MIKMNKIDRVSGALIGLTAILVVVIVVDFIRFNNVNDQVGLLSTRISSLENTFSSTTNELKGNITRTRDDLADQITRDRTGVSNLAQDLRQQVGSVTNTVTTLQKLSKTDPELLSKYSKVFFLNENYAPERIAEIPTSYRYSDAKVLKVSEPVLPYLEKMIDAANAIGTKMFVFSAYRSFSEQQALKGQYTITYGAGTANSFSADQGYSEHQLGTTVDMIAPGLGGSLDGFDATPAYTWLINNAYRFGFIISYPKNNKFYQFEPWHWRFVGVQLATDLHALGKNFYDLDQREIDKYLVDIFD